MGESQRTPVGSGGKVLLPFSDNYSPLEKQLLACYQALVEVKLIIMGHQLTMQPELPIMNWILYATLSHENSTYRSIPSSNGSGIDEIGLEQSLKVQLSHMKKLPKYS